MVVRFLLKNQRKQNCFGFDYFLSLVQLQDTTGALSEENDIICHNSKTKTHSVRGHKLYAD